MIIDKYTVNRGLSIFTSRFKDKKEDCTICRIHSDISLGGSRIEYQKNGKLAQGFETLVAIFACEDGSEVRRYERLNENITLDVLVELGFIDKR